MPFTKDTYKNVFESADNMYLSTKQVVVAAVAKPVTDMNETVSAFDPVNQPQVAAVGRGNGRGGRNRRNRGGRGGSGRGGNQNQNGQGGAQGGSQGTKTRKRHASMPPEACCERHYVHGDQAWYCLAPTTCPWLNKVIARP